ncbi:MAG TPA: sulfite exporter TauE/SafE family protein [Methylomirabilota bacterium]|nr:sulfite exporter TauE/SafE family protein [Methylomirabilota bacterium]
MPAADRAPGGSEREASRRAPLGGARPIAWLFASLAIVAASFVKGVVAFGFPLVATPLLALALDVKTAVAVSIVPNIVMDSVQAVRGGGTWSTVRRLAVLLVFGIMGMFVGTRLLAVLPPRVATMSLGMFVLIFVTLSVTGVTLRVPLACERWLSPPIGFIAGILGGLTNVPGTALVIYFRALGMGKQEFVRSVALSFMTYKIIQLIAVAYYGLLGIDLVLISVGLTVVGLAAFALGLKVQDRLPEKTFNRTVTTFLAALGLWLVARSV